MVSIPVADGNESDSRWFVRSVGTAVTDGRAGWQRAHPRHATPECQRWSKRDGWLHFSRRPKAIEGYPAAHHVEGHLGQVDGGSAVRHMLQGKEEAAAFQLLSDSIEGIKLMAREGFVQLVGNREVSIEPLED